MKPLILKAGTIDLDMVETTPIVFGGELYRFEYVRPNYWANPTGDSYFRFLGARTGNPSPPFAHGYHLGNVFVEDETLFVTGTNIWDGERVDIFCSDIDFCEYRGSLSITYSWGNQQGVEHLAEARYEGSLAEFLAGWFPEGEPDPN